MTDDEAGRSPRAARGGRGGGDGGRGSNGGGGKGGPGGRDGGKPRSRGRRLAAWLIGLPLALVVSAGLVAALAAVLATYRLPALDVLIDYQPKVPMHIYSADGLLIGEFGEERRTVVRISDFPDRMKRAILAAEDDRFYEHSGVDLSGMARAFLANLRSGGRGQGGSTITMQVARTFFLSRERSYVRKLYEVLLSWKIESTLTKDQILEIYANQIFLGQRSYGFGAAAQTYFAKPLNQLTTAQMAMLAGLPKAPSSFNPVVNPGRAKDRQLYVLGRMRHLGYISEAEFQQARDEDIRVRPERLALPLDAKWAAEMARALTVDLYKTEAYTTGLSVYTTIVARDQQAATSAVRKAVADYDRRNGYRGPEAYIDLPADPARRENAIVDAIDQAGDEGEMLAAVITRISGNNAVTVSRGREVSFDIGAEGLKAVTRWLNQKNPADRQLRPGAVVRIQDGNNGWEITQRPQVEAAFISVDTRDGAVRSMVGGFDFARSKFNRTTQGVRQPGSVFKPFIYSAALEKGFMASTIVNDAPIILDPAVTGGQLWEPKNFDGKYDGAMTMRTALARSKNMVSIRLLQSIGTDYAQDYISRFGFVPERNPAYLTMALGAGSVTPWQLAGGFSVFANGGYKVQPYLISRITDASGNEIAKVHPPMAGDESNRVIDGRNAFIVDSMMRDVVRRGTATQAYKTLKRQDLAGKTGTTNEAHDAWFAGYGGGITGVAWVGFDQPRSLGDRETGGGLALPIWTDYMGQVLAKVKEQPRVAPAGIEHIAGEYYLSEVTPGHGISSLGVTEDGLSTDDKHENVRDQIF